MPLNNLIRKIYGKGQNITYFLPLELNENFEKIELKKFFKLNLKNFNLLKTNYKYFLVFKKRPVKDFLVEKLRKMKNLYDNHGADVVYDGDDKFYTEITSRKALEVYLKDYSLEKYPDRFFYIKDKIKVKSIGSEHRSYNFNGTFNLPSGGRSIGDGGPVENRLRFIPDLSGKTFLDIGSEEGYSVFDALKKNAKFAKGLNINELEEYDFFPDYLRPKEITSRKREEIEKTQKFLLKEYNLETNSRIKFEYNNIYNLGPEKFDFVFCFGVLYHLKNPYLAIENLYKVTKETLFLETQGIKNQNYFNAKISMDDGFIRHSSNALSFLLKKAGFKKVEIILDAYDKRTLENYTSSSNIQNIVLKAQK